MCVVKLNKIIFHVKVDDLEELCAQIVEMLVCLLQNVDELVKLLHSMLPIVTVVLEKANEL
jgi:hypothetical protein